MKYLSDYMNNKQSALFKETGSFFAFGTQQFEEQRKPGVTYVQMGAGLLCPEGKQRELSEGLDKIYHEAIQQDLKENGKDAVIRRELHNYECFYSGDTTDAEKVLLNYPTIAIEDINRIYRQELAKGDCWK